MKRPEGFSHNPPAAPAKPARTPSSATAPVRPPRSLPGADSGAQLGAKKLASQRKKYERSEIRRFTQRSRNRRVRWFAAISIVIVFVILVGLAVFSPLLALTKITVLGASRLSPTVLSSAMSDQLGKPLALVDFDAITRDLAKFPLIRSYTTEAAPPHTLVVRIVERTPIGSVQTAVGFELIDPAGVIVDSVATRPPTLPVLQVDTPTLKNAAFRSVVSVLLALPADLEAKVDSISATTKDNVTFVLAGVGQSVVWGSSDRSSYKARVLAALIRTQNPNAHLQFDVSAPDSVVVRQK